jgi:exosome complex RNA-binding protein Rrp42 (RNase PH superfamily)
LAAFLDEAGLPQDAGSASSRVLTIEQVLQEKKAYDLSVNFEKLGVEEKSKAWVVPGM